MTEEERLAKNNRIREQCKLTRDKRKTQICRVYRVKIDISHLNEAQRVHLKMLFVEAKWLYNDALTFTQEHDISDYNTATHTVHGLDKDKQPVTHELEYLGSQMKQSVIQGIKHSLKSLSALKKNNHTVGNLRYKSDYISINLQQHRVTYRFYDEYHIGIQGIKEQIRIRGANQFWNIPGLEFANAKLLNLPDGYYLAITTNRKKDTANKIVHELLEHEHIYMQDENLKGWHKGLFGRTVQHSILGLVKAKLAGNERVTMLSSREPTTKYCPVCGKLKRDITLADRTYECTCGYHEDRDIHAARNMILLSRKHTCGTQETFNPAFGEDVRHWQNIAVQPRRIRKPPLL